MFFNKKTTYNKSDFSTIIEACRLSNENAQRELIYQYYGYAKTVCNLYSKTQEENEEMINDGFLKLFNNLDKYNSNKPFKSWFRVLLVNSCIDYYRKYQKQHNIISLEQANDIEIENDILDNISAEEIQKFILELPNACRIVFTLYVMEGYSHKEIGELLDIQEGTSKSNLRDARIKLKKKLINHFDHELIFMHSSKTQA